LIGREEDVEETTDTIPLSLSNRSEISSTSVFGFLSISTIRHYHHYKSSASNKNNRRCSVGSHWRTRWVRTSWVTCSRWVATSTRRSAGTRSSVPSKSLRSSTAMKYATRNVRFISCEMLLPRFYSITTMSWCLTDHCTCSDEADVPDPRQVASRHWNLSLEHLRWFCKALLAWLRDASDLPQCETPNNSLRWFVAVWKLKRYLYLYKAKRSTLKIQMKVRSIHQKWSYSRRTNGWLPRCLTKSLFTLEHYRRYSLSSHLSFSIQQDSYPQFLRYARDPATILGMRRTPSSTTSRVELLPLISNRRISIRSVLAMSSRLPTELSTSGFVSSQANREDVCHRFRLSSLSTETAYSQVSLFQKADTKSFIY